MMRIVLVLLCAHCIHPNCGWVKKERKKRPERLQWQISVERERVCVRAPVASPAQHKAHLFHVLSCVPSCNCKVWSGFLWTCAALLLLLLLFCSSATVLCWALPYPHIRTWTIITLDSSFVGSFILIQLVSLVKVFLGFRVLDWN